MPYFVDGAAVFAKAAVVVACFFQTLSVPNPVGGKVKQDALFKRGERGLWVKDDVAEMPTYTWAEAFSADLAFASQVPPESNSSNLLVTLLATLRS